ncbi:hypothetical protein [Bradyrhizobium sp. STM 3557]|uniref:hypothetical protein n=1 Tax=Bradyrhizobium sp. STM 3557 TaxID=578920 RepID=UPI00389119B8
MGAYRYCPKCGSGMSSPTIREVFKGKQHCGDPWTGQPCDYVHEVEDHERDLAIEEFIDAAEATERRMKRIESLLGLSE